jgi:hypothetical protein
VRDICKGGEQYTGSPDGARELQLVYRALFRSGCRSGALSKIGFLAAAPSTLKLIVLFGLTLALSFPIARLTGAWIEDTGIRMGRRLAAAPFQPDVGAGVKMASTLAS